jgi:hypothetical protein
MIAPATSIAEPIFIAILPSSAVTRHAPAHVCRPLI